MKIEVTVKSNSTKGPLITSHSDGSSTIYVREVASDGQANIALIKLISKHFRVPKSKIKIIHGQTSKHKLIEIDIQ